MGSLDEKAKNDNSASDAVTDAEKLIKFGNIAKDRDVLIGFVA